MLRRLAAGFFVLGLILVTAAVTLAVLLTSEAPALATKLLRDTLQTQGLPNGPRVTRVSFTGVEIRGLDLGPAVIDRTVVAFDARALAERREIESVTMSGVDVRLSIDDSGKPDLGALASLLEPTEGEASEPPAISVRRISASEIELDLQSPWGTVKGFGSLDVSDLETVQADLAGFAALEGQPVTAFELVGDYEDDRVSVRLTGQNDWGHFALDGPDIPLAFDREVPLTLDLNITQGPSGIGAVGALSLLISEDHLAVAPLTPFVVRAEGHEVMIPAEAGNRFDLQFTQMSNWTFDLNDIALTPAAPIPTVMLNGKAYGDLSEIDFTGRVSDRFGDVTADLSATYNRMDETANARFSLKPITFQPGLFEPRDLGPFVPEGLPAIQGRLEAEGVIAWEESRLRPDITIRFKEGTVTQDGLSASGVNTALRLNRFSPLRITEGELEIDRIGTALPHGPFETTFELRDDRLTLSNARLRALGGELVMASVSADLASGRLETDVAFEGLELATLFQVLELPGSSGQGRLGGRLPLVFVEGSVSIDQGRVAGLGAGVIRYESLAPTESYGDPDQGMGLMMRALEDFRYDRLSLDLNRPEGGDWSALLSLAGRNPAVLEGYPFEFNINVTGALEALVRRSLAAYHLPATIGRMLSSGR